MNRLRKYPSRLTSEIIKEYEEKGLWKNKTIIDYFKNRVEQFPDKVVIIDHDKRITYEQLWTRVNALAVGLKNLGIEEGDIVSYQLPNWLESAEVHLAVTLLGAINNPVNFIYRNRELEYVLNDAKSKILFIPRQFRGTDFIEAVENVSDNTPYLQHVITVGEKQEGYLFIDDIIQNHLGEEVQVEVDPNATSFLMYTSGTTSIPKGVEHTQNSMIAEISYITEMHKESEDDIYLIASPVTHITGTFLKLSTIYQGATMVFMDKWDVQKALELIEKEKVTAMRGATPFLQQIIYHEDLDKYDISSLKRFGCGGANVYPELIYDAAKKGIQAYRGYGSTEHPSIANSTHFYPIKQRAETDGVVHEHNEVKIVDLEDPTKELPIGSVGEICTKGPELFLGYHQEELNKDAFDKDGYFFTGDIGRLNPDNTLVILDRKKDIIIRKGENISSKEIEDLIYEHPDVKEVAVVGLKDKERGERVTAVIVLKEGKSLKLKDLNDFLDSKEISKRKLPEQLEIFDELPKNASGKIEKYKIKQILEKSTINN